RRCLNPSRAGHWGARMRRFSMEHPPELPIHVRSFRADDLPACRKLYVEGLLGGRLAENDTGLDIDDIDSAYMKTPGNHFWVAETTAAAAAAAAADDGAAGQIVGMIGVQHHEA